MTDDAEDQADPEITPDEVPALLRIMEARRDGEERAFAKVATSPDYPDVLRSAFATYSEENTFDIGVLVQWKPMMRNRRYPIEGIPAIVVRRLEPPQLVDSDGDPLDEPWDLVVGVVDGTHTFRLTQMASTRLMPWSE
ncbi:hypothetical protein [Microbacterium sp. KRD174]